jgi:hypothetical protein
MSSFEDTRASLEAVIEGRADVTLADAVEPWVRQALESSQVRFLELAADDPQGAMRFRRFAPFGKLSRAPAETAKDARGLNVFLGTACLWCRPDFDSDLAYEFTKWCDSSYDLYRSRGAKLISYTRRAFRECLDVAMAPVHDGTVRYMKEIGLWTQADEARQKYNLRLMELYCQAWDDARKRAEQEGIRVSPANDKWVRLWQDCKKRARIPHYRQMTDDEITAGLARMKESAQ